MRLKKNIPIIIVIFTVITFISLHISSNKEIPYINTISGDIEELDDINVIISENERSYYKDYEYVINKDYIDKNVYKKLEYGSYIDIIDVSSGEDNIANIGFHDTDYLIIDVSTNNQTTNTILDAQGKDRYILDDRIDHKNINRNKYKIENPPDIYLRAVSSYRYKSELYILIEDDNCNLHIIKINPNDLHISHVESINLVDYVSNIKSMSYSIQNIKSKDNKFYISIWDTNITAKQEYLYVISYDVETNKNDISKIIIEDDVSDINIMVNEDHIDIFYINENEEFYIQKVDKNTNKIVDKNKVFTNIDLGYVYMTSDEDKVYILNDTSDYKTSKNYFEILVFDKNKNEITYEGEILGLSKFDVDIQKR